MNIHCISEDVVQQIKESIENSSVNTNHTGYTDIMIKKMLLASSATRYTKHTLCVAETNRDEILEGTNYTTLTSFFNNECSKKSSKDVDGWNASNDYDLYFVTKRIFYFKDKDGIITQDPNQPGDTSKYYIGIMGAIEIASTLGSEFVYVDRANFEKAKEEYLNLSAVQKRNDSSKDNLLNKYTMDDQGNFIVYKLIENVKEYDYSMKNGSTTLFTQEGYEGEKMAKDMADSVGLGGVAELITSASNSSYNIQEVTFNVEENINVAQYTLPIELLINMLDFTGSPEYIDTFIDYALDNSGIEFTVYNLETSTIEYDYETFEINKNFVLEIYEMVALIGDNGGDNLTTYKPLIYDRKHNGSSFSGSVVDLSNYGNINYDTNSNQVGPIKDYLKTAYDPGDNFSINGDITVEQLQIIRKFENELQFEVSSVSSWYADIEYPDLQVKVDYTIDGIGVTVNEYIAYDYTSEGMIAANPSTEDVTDIFISKARASEIGITGDLNNNNRRVKVINSPLSLLYSHDLNKGYGVTNWRKFRYFAVKGLGEIAINDEGDENDWVGVIGARSDYIYTKYKKENIKTSKSKEKKKEEYTDSATNLPSVDLSKVNTFLSLWKNQTGNKNNRNYSSNGVKVEYEDVYKKIENSGAIIEGKTIVGDIFESAPQMFFELLEASENTRDLVDIFKYIMYVYTGIDYGITDASQLEAILQTQGTYIGSSFIIKTDEPNAAPELTRDQLEQAINAHSGQTKTNLLSALDGFMYIQENYNVNAVFAMAVARAESSGGINWGRISSSTNNWMSVQGSYNGATWTGTDGQNWRVYDSFNTATIDFGTLISGGLYFGDGRYDVASIGQRYCPPGDSWNQTVTTIMKEIYNKAGVQVSTVSPGNATGGSEGPAQGNVTTFSVGERTYNNYKQINPSYQTVKLANYNDNLFMSGCAVVSVTIVATGFGHNVDPISVNNYYEQLGSSNHIAALSHFTGGMKVESIAATGNNFKAGVLEQLGRGYPVMVHVKPNNGTFKTNYGHFFVILSVSESGDQIYVSDPASTRSTRTGWMSVNVLNESGFDRYYKIGE